MSHPSPATEVVLLDDFADLLKAVHVVEIFPRNARDDKERRLFIKDDLKTKNTSTLGCCALIP